MTNTKGRREPRDSIRSGLRTRAPAGLDLAGKEGPKEECLAYIEEVLD